MLPLSNIRKNTNWSISKKAIVRKILYTFSGGQNDTEEHFLKFLPQLISDLMQCALPFFKIDKTNKQVNKLKNVLTVFS